MFLYYLVLSLFPGLNQMRCKCHAKDVSAPHLGFAKCDGSPVGALTLGPFEPLERLESKILVILHFQAYLVQNCRESAELHTKSKGVPSSLVGIDWNGLEWHVPRAFHFCHFCHFCHFIHLMVLCTFGTLSGKPWTETQL